MGSQRICDEGRSSLLSRIPELLAKLADELPVEETSPLPLRELPDQFRPLKPLIRKWGISD